MRAGALVVLLGAILPNVAYIGHANVGGVTESTNHSHEHAHPAAGSGDHEVHCHGASSCADQVAHAAPWWAEVDGDRAVATGTEHAQGTTVEQSPLEPNTGPLHPPPQFA